MSAPVPQQSRFGGMRPAAVSAASGGAVVTALTMANAPWQAVVGTVCATLVVSLLLGLAKIVVPDESEHKRDLLLAYFRYRERRAKQREHRAELRIRRRRQRDQGTNSQEQHDRPPGDDHPLR
ncbi:hypothetical protein GCM10010313_83000 [Streptomyces violarus]|uniref:Mannitol-specific phosphotransferase system IIBC component n=1 Tax=Streptomyces violarus TaxID=67380 RepID=A0A7W5F6F1_9ACTN|nr:hypothetical protein [Streptomyces violarus]MBB3081766.1 mannitol-specific phosphotransferase system IIBC component [Streptomyces violarus]GHD35553.1 hypothetical protein GCM10010313_83000 [Streptomyces violarus]